MIVGKMTQVFAIMRLPVESVPVSVAHALHSFMLDQLRDISPVPVSIIGRDVLYTFLYSEKEEVRKSGSGVFHPRDRNPRSPEDFNRRSLVVVLLIFRRDFSWSHSWIFKTKIFPESVPNNIYPVKVFTLDEESHPVFE